jgi:hypothetical protein
MAEYPEFHLFGWLRYWSSAFGLNIEVSFFSPRIPLPNIHAKSSTSRGIPWPEKFSRSSSLPVADRLPLAPLRSSSASGESESCPCPDPFLPVHPVPLVRIQRLCMRAPPIELMRWAMSTRCWHSAAATPFQITPSPCHLLCSISLSVCTPDASLYLIFFSMQHAPVNQVSVKTNNGKVHNINVPCFWQCVSTSASPFLMDNKVN